MGAELFHAERHTDQWADGQTDMVKLIVAFRNVLKEPKNVLANCLLQFLVHRAAESCPLVTDGHDSHNSW